MGWGKYFEDNVSIYVGRVVMKSISVRLPKSQPVSGENSKVYYVKRCPIEPTKPHAKTAVQAIDESNRHGLELRFVHNVDRATEKKLRLNRWWHKQSETTWFNNNTKSNREFAEYFVTNKLAHLEVVKDIE